MSKDIIRFIGCGPNADMVVQVVSFTDSCETW